MFRQIVYVSVADPLLGAAGLRILVDQSQRNNRLDRVTGALVYSNDVFLQLIEGESPDMKRLLARLESDPRHSRMTVLVDRMVGTRGIPLSWMHLCDLSPGVNAGSLEGCEVAACLMAALRQTSAIPAVRVAFPGFHRLEELAGDYWAQRSATGTAAI